MRMSANLRTFEYALRDLKLAYALKQDSEEFRKKVELAELRVHLTDGNYNRKMVERALVLARELGGEVREYEGCLKALNGEEKGSRGRLLVLDEVLELIKKDLLVHEREVSLNYETAVAKLELQLQKTNYRKEERGYAELVKATWVNLREEMYRAKGDKPQEQKVVREQDYLPELVMERNR